MKEGKEKWEKVGEEHERKEDNKCLVIKAKRKLASRAAPTAGAGQPTFAAVTVCHPGSLRLSITSQSF